MCLVRYGMIRIGKVKLYLYAIAGASIITMLGFQYFQVKNLEDRLAKSNENLVRVSVALESQTLAINLMQENMGRMVVANENLNRDMVAVRQSRDEIIN